MSKTAHLVEELRDRLTSMADQEQKLVSSLRDALTRVDQKLLQEVRTITAEHESRRSVILSELQGLAARLGVFPTSRSDTERQVREDTRPGLNGLAPATEQSPSTGLRAVQGGAWRDATDKLQNELDSYFRKRA